MLRFAGAEAQIDQLHAVARRPFDCLSQPLDAGNERALEHFDRVELGLRRLLADSRGDCSSMPQAVQEIAGFVSVLRNPDAAGDTAYVRVRSMNAAVDDGDADPSPGFVRKEVRSAGRSNHCV